MTLQYTEFLLKCDFCNVRSLGVLLLPLYGLLLKRMFPLSISQIAFSAP